MVGAQEDAYQVLGLARTCTREEIKKAFQELAKATHPDLQQGSDHGDGGKQTSARFIRVLAAYQILSDPQRRSVYDSELSARVYASTAAHHASTSSASASRRVYRARARYTSSSSSEGSNWENFRCEFYYEETADDSEVVEWLRQYRSKVTRIVHQRELGTSSRFLEPWHADLRTALTRMYYGPDIKHLRGFPDAFEADERSNPYVDDVLQLVYGRFLFATVRVARDSSANFPKHEDEQAYEDHKLWSLVDRAAYGKLELRLNGAVRAYALRRPLYTSELHDKPFVMDSISVYSEDEETGERLVGRIQGLASTEAGMKAVVFDGDGNVTHSILQHRTPLVKHLHWYRLNEDRIFCDCRCRRAWLFPSRYWIFQPRTMTHNIGGWYIETFKPRRRPATFTKLHPAVYILAAAYKTLDTETLNKRKLTASLVNSASRMFMMMKKKWKLH